jgi:hypothetical protein
MATISLPFNLSSRGGSVRITQGFGGETSHNKWLYNSLDFAVPRGTALTALAAGKVIDVWEKTPEGGLGPSNMGNIVTVHYPSLGIYVTYAHLAHNSVVPEKNATVSAGQILAYVGNTGYSDGPHAHAQYGTSTVLFGGQITVADARGALPTVFDTATGQLPQGVVSEVNYDLSKSGGGLNLSLVGAGNINGSGDRSANILSGNRGKNSLDGREGNDSIFGGDGDDKLVGGEGRDRLTGGAGRDELGGGRGSDVFIFGSGDTGKTAGTRDRILDFSAKEGDKIDLSAIDANSVKSGDQSFAFVGTKAFSGKAGELALHGTFLEGDVNGDRIADFQIDMGSTTNLNSTDFVL